MQPTRALGHKKNLLLTLDAFGTLFHPRKPPELIYRKVAQDHGILSPSHTNDKTPGRLNAWKGSFTEAFRKANKEHPNYGKEDGMDVKIWWEKVLRDTYRPFLPPGKELPTKMINHLYNGFSNDTYYKLIPGVFPFFRNLRWRGNDRYLSNWDNVVVGVITNSDDRVTSVLQSFGKGEGLRVGSMRFGTSSVQPPGRDIAFVVQSYDVGVRKPDRRIFEAAEETLTNFLSKRGDKPPLSADSFEKLHVGDDSEEDFVAARNAGWHALLKTRNVQDVTALEEHIKEVNEEHDFPKTSFRNSVIVNLSEIRDWRP